MKNRFKIAVVSWLISLPLFATPPDVGFSVDLATPTVKWEFTTFAGNTPSFPVQILTNGLPYNGFTGYTPQFNYFPSDSSSAGKTISGTLSGSIATFVAVSNSFPVKGEFFAEVFFLLGSSKITAGQGALHVQRSPSGGSYGSLNLLNRINWDVVTNIGTFPWSDFDTNYLGAQITANLNSQIATSAVFQALFNAQKNTNTGFQSDITTLKGFTNYAYTAWTWGDWETNRLATTNQLGVVSQMVVTAQSDITNNLANQILTNAYFETSKTSHTAQIISLQTTTGLLYAATNSINTAVTNNLYRQSLTNVYFEAAKTSHAAQISGLQTATGLLYVATNALNTAITNNFYRQSLTNAYFETSKTSHTAQIIILNTATGALDTRVTSNEGYTNDAYTAYGWGDHAVMGYLTANTNIFESVFVGNMCKVNTNLCNLTGVYTGVPATSGISYTGTVGLTVGDVYVVGFTKQNAFGSVTMSVDGLTIHGTAAGNVSNYFGSASTITTNVIVSIYGNGASKSDVSSVYIKLVTNGNAYVSENLYVGQDLYINSSPVPLGPAVVAISNTVDRHTLEIASISNKVDGLNSRSSTWDTVTSKADNSALISVSNKVDGLNSRSSTWDTVTSKADNSALISVSNVVDGLNSRSSTWDTVTSMAANSALIAVSNVANGLNSRSSIWERVTTGDYLATSNDVDVVEALTAGLNARSSTWDNAVNVANGLNARSSVWDKASTDAIQATNNIVVSSNFFENRLDTVDTATNSINTAVTNNLYVQSLTNANFEPRIYTSTTGKVAKVGDIMTGPLTNTVGFFGQYFTGDGGGLTNISGTDLSGYSGNAATQEIFWSYSTAVIFTNILVTGSGLSLPVQGNYTYAGVHNVSNYWSSTNSYSIYFSGAGGVPSDYWILNDGVEDNPGNFYYARLSVPVGDYIAGLNTTGTPTAVFSYITNTIDWQAGADPADAQKWHITQGGTNIYRAYAGSNVFDKPIYGNGANLAGVATGTPVYAETDSIATNLIAVTSNHLESVRSDLTNRIEIVSNQVFALEVSTNTLNTVANAALPKAGGTMTGPLTNNVAVWLPANGIVYFGTSTNYIKDQDGTNFMFMSGTNWAVFGW